MDDVDRRVAAMLEDRSKIVHTVPPGRTWPSVHPDPATRERSLETTPQTVNPAAETFRFDVASESRDVAAKLEEYAVESYGSSVQGEGLRDAISLTLAESWRRAQRGARDYLTAEEDYILAVIRLLIEQHRWDVRYFNDTTLTATNTWDDGSPSPALNIINTLRAQKQLPSGGEVEAAWVTRASQDLREQVSAGYEQSSAVRLSATVPLLRGAGPVARESLIQSQRDLIYAARSFERFRRRFLVSIADDYFRLIQTQAEITNQERSLASLRTFRDGVQARVDAGRIPAFNVSIAENDVLNAQASLASLRERYILQLDQFKVRLGLDLKTPVVVKPLLIDVPIPATTLDAATAAALDFRLDLQTARDRVDDARRAVANAENAVLPDLNVGARATLPTNPRDDVSGLSFSPRDANVEGVATLSLPLDRTIERLSVRQATIQLQQRERSLDETRDEVVISVRGALRGIDLAAFQLKLAEQQVEINRRRLQEQLLKIDTVEPRDVVQSENDLLAAENRRDQRKTDLRNAVLNYLLESDQLRVAPDGVFQPLPGMLDPRPQDPPANP